MRALLHNAVIVNEDRQYLGYVEISAEGKIVSVSQGEPTAELLDSYRGATTDLGGHRLLPGVIDSHVHFREPGGEHKATIASESRAAVAGGVTSFMEMPNTNPATITLEALEDKFARAAKDSVANYSFYIGATKDNLSVLKAVDYHRVPGVKLFMGSSTGGMLVEGEDALSEIFKLPVLIAVHCEDEATIKSNTKAVKDLYGDTDPEIIWHCSIRDAIACVRSTAHAIALAERYGTRLHIMHLTTLQELRMLSQTSPHITGEACVAHLMFDDRDYARLGTRIKCNPAVKSAAHRDALRRGVREGVISTVSTDHAPHTAEEKDRGLFGAPSGMPMVQFSLPAMLDLALRVGWPLHTVVRAMAHSQADIFGVEQRGYIRPGYWADLVEVDPEGTTEVRSGNILSKCGWSPLEGLDLRTKVVKTWVNGNLVWDANVGLLTEAPAGRELRFQLRKKNL